MSDNNEQFDIFKPKFSCNIKEYHPLVLSFVGDAIYTMFVRSYFVNLGKNKTNGLHSLTSSVVNANKQSECLDFLIPNLTQDEIDICKKARNAHTNNVAKNSNLANYKKSSAFEALLGYCYMKSDLERLNFLMTESIKFCTHGDNI